MASFPSSLDSFAGFTAGDTLKADNHAAQHNLEQGAIVATETKLGTGSSTPTNNTVLRGNGTGTTAYDQVHLATDVSGVIATTNGGTGSSTITGSGLPVFQTAPTITNPTESGGTYNSATINTPTITYSNNSIPAAAIVNNSLGTTQLGTNIALPPITSNPYKFSVYRNAAANSGNGAFALLACDTKIFDTGSNVDVVTNKGRFTAPVAGFYQFNACVASGAGGGANHTLVVDFYKGGALINQGGAANTQNAAAQASASALIQLSANDYVEAFVYGDVTLALAVGAQANNVFSGFLVSAT